MKQFVCLVLFVYFCGVSPHEHEHVDDLRLNEQGSIPRSATGRMNTSFLAKPCPSLDIHCISQALANLHLCHPLGKPTPVPFPTILELPLYAPHVNMTGVVRNGMITGLNEYSIKNFYINEKTDRLVMEVEFPAVTYQTPKSYLVFHMKGKEPVITGDFMSGSYTDLSFTLVVSNLRTKPRTHVYTYINTLPEMSLGSKLVPSDPVALASYTTMLELLGTSLKEFFVNLGPATVSIFLRSFGACDLQFSHFQF